MDVEYAQAVETILASVTPKPFFPLANSTNWATVDSKKDQNPTYSRTTSLGVTDICIPAIASPPPPRY